MNPIPAHVLAAVPDDCEGEVYDMYWQNGAVVVGILLDSYDHLEIVRVEPGMSVQDAETHAVQFAAMGFLAGLVQHRLDFGDPVSDDDLLDALAAATTRGDLDVADLLELAVERGLGPIEPAPAARHMGYRH